MDLGGGLQALGFLWSSHSQAVVSWLFSASLGATLLVSDSLVQRWPLDTFLPCLSLPTISSLEASVNGGIKSPWYRLAEGPSLWARIGGRI